MNGKVLFINRKLLICFAVILFQIEPDPEFSTVKYPNPEEGKSVLVSRHFGHGRHAHKYMMIKCNVLQTL